MPGARVQAAAVKRSDPARAAVSALRLHPLAVRVPEMRPAERRAFLEHVRQWGILEPPRLAYDGVTVLDGRHRLKAARELGLESVPARLAASEPGDETGYVIRAAPHSRHLSGDQRAVLAVELAEAMGVERGRAQRQAAVRSRWGRSKAPPAGTDGRGGAPSVSPPRSRDQATQALGVSRQRFESPRIHAAADPDLSAQVGPGEPALPVARKAAERKGALAELASRPPSGPPHGADLWQGDCIALAPRIPDGSVDLILTDPPHGIAGRFGSGRRGVSAPPRSGSQPGPRLPLELQGGRSSAIAMQFEAESAYVDGPDRARLRDAGGPAPGHRREHAEAFPAGRHHTPRAQRKVRQAAGMASAVRLRC